MNTKTLLTVKTDKKLKEAAQELAETLGFSLGTLVNAYLKQFVRTKEVAFQESYKPSKYLEMVINESRVEYKQEKADGILKIYKNVDDIWKDLEV